MVLAEEFCYVESQIATQILKLVGEILLGIYMGIIKPEPFFMGLFYT